MSRRTDRVNALLREQLSELLRGELSDPRIAGVVSVTRVDVAPDLRRANAYVSVLGTEDERASTMRALESARPFLRRELRRRLVMKTTPEVTFVEDTSMEEAQRVTDLLRRSAAERGESF
jgi:ribosome-binding factor A